MMMGARRASVRILGAAGKGGGMEASVTENLRRGGDPPQGASCGVPLERWKSDSLGVSAPSMKSAAPKARGADRIAAQEFEVAAVHELDGAGDDAVDLLAQRRVLPFDGRDMARICVQ